MNNANQIGGQDFERTPNHDEGFKKKLVSGCIKIRLLDEIKKIADNLISHTLVNFSVFELFLQPGRGFERRLSQRILFRLSILDSRSRADTLRD
jgi:hypothetical protein